MGSSEWYTLLKEIENLKSYDAIKDIVPGYELFDFQCVDLLKIMHTKKQVLCYETGMGKTLMAGAMINAVRHIKPNAKFIVFVLKSQLGQTPSKLKEYTGLNITYLTSEQDMIYKKMVAKDFIHSDILILTHECLNSQKVMSMLFAARAYYTGIIVDEIHNVANFHKATSSFMLFNVMNAFEYCLSLTATPITTDVKKAAQIMYMTNRDSVYDLNNASETLQQDGISVYHDVVTVRTRKELGIITNYKVNVVKVKPLAHQIGANGIDMFNVTKGEGAVNQIKALIKTIKDYPEYYKGLIYIRHHEIRKFVVEELEKAGINCGVINGLTSLNKRAELCKEFNENRLNLIITSITESLDLDCEYIIFYEFDISMQQMLGRGNRGLNPKQLDLNIFFTEKTGEADYFIRNIYARSLMFQTVMGTELSYIKEMANEIL